MKKIFKTGVFAMFLLGMVSCGGSVDSGELVGEWTPELSSMEINISDEIPAMYRSMIEDGLADKENLEDAQKELEKSFKMEFKDDGKLVVGAEGESQEMEWRVEDDRLFLKGDVRGQEGEVGIQIVESSSESMTLLLDGKDLLQQAYDQQGEMAVDMALNMASGMDPMLEGMDLKKAISDSNIKLTFNKK